MRVLTLARCYLSDKTVGLLFGGDVYFKTLEQPWRGNAQRISCIPEGVYSVKRDKAGRHQLYAVQDVGNRTFIEFHAGNKVSHSKGCILLGMNHSSNYELVESQKACDEMLELMGDDDFILHIRAATKDDF